MAGGESKFASSGFGFGGSGEGNVAEHLHRSDEAVASARQSFHKPGIGSGIAERVAEFPHRSVESLFEVDESVAPEFFADIIPCHHLARVLKQENQ